MFIFIVMFVIIAILAVTIYFILPLIKEETATIKEEIQEAKKEEEARKKPTNTLKTLLEEKSVEEILPKISNDPRKIQKLKAFLEEELKEAMRQKNTEKIRECNQNLKAVQIAENNLKGN